MDQIKKLYKIRQNCMNMLNLRGYKTENIQNVIFDEFFIMVEENNYDIIDDENKIILYFHKENKNLGKKDIEIISNNCKKNTNNPNIKIVIIFPDQNTNFLIESNNIELFSYDQLIVDITNHSLVPKYKLLNPDEEKILFEKYKIKKNNLPKIKSSDPQMKFYGFKIGSVIESNYKENYSYLTVI